MAAERTASRVSRLATELRLKVTVLLGLAVGICGPYFALQRIRLFPLRQPPVVAPDAWIPFSPDWVYPYLTICVLVPLFPLLATEREALLRYARGLALLCTLSFAIFLLFPVAGPRPTLVPDHPVYGWLVGVDAPLNSMPSLHAALTTYSFLFGARVVRWRRGLFPVLACLWGGAIFYSTLATRQHWLADVPAGIALAWAAHRWAWRRVR